jgi:HlyD family secretion protein
MHTATAEVIPDPASPHDPPKTQPEPPKPQNTRPKRLGFWIAITAAVLIVSLILLLKTRSNSPPSGKAAQSTVRVPAQVLRLKGTTEAVQSRSVLAPLLAGQQVATLTIVRMIPAGTRVKQGDLLVEFDRQAQIRDFIDKQAEYGKLVDQVAEEQAKESAARAKDETELKQAEDNLRKTELEIQKAEIVSRIDAEKNQENLDEAKATYGQLRETFDLKRKAAQAAIRILEIQRDRT